jgi:hypothetical protein
LAHADRLRLKLPASARVKCAPLAGVFPPWGQYSVFMKDVAALHGVTSSLFAMSIVASLKVPVFLMQSSYDSWGLRFVFKDAAWLSCITREVLHNCSLSQRQRLAAEWHGPVTELLLRFVRVLLLVLFS